MRVSEREERRRGKGLVELLIILIYHSSFIVLLRSRKSGKQTSSPLQTKKNYIYIEW